MTLLDPSDSLFSLGVPTLVKPGPLSQIGVPNGFFWLNYSERKEGRKEGNVGGNKGEIERGKEGVREGGEKQTKKKFNKIVE